MARILLVEDDQRISRPLARELTRERHTLDVAEDGEQGWSYLTAGAYDLAIVDVLLPGLNGFELCRRMREFRSKTPVLLLTALDSSENKVRGLDAGADDYLVKPFCLQELHARLRALLRRGSVAPVSLRWGPLQLDPVGQRVLVGPQELSLTPREFQIMELFLRSPGRAYKTEDVLEKIWGWDAPGKETVKTHMRGLREKLREAGLNPIETLYGRGYRLAYEP